MYKKPKQNLDPQFPRNTHFNNYQEFNNNITTFEISRTPKEKQHTTIKKKRRPRIRTGAWQFQRRPLNSESANKRAGLVWMNGDDRAALGFYYQSTRFYWNQQ